MKKFSFIKPFTTGVFLLTLNIFPGYSQTTISVQKATFLSPVAGGVGEYIQNNKQTPTEPFGLSFYTNSNPRMSISGINGFVGIGTQAPISPLTVKGYGNSGTIRILPNVSYNESSIGLYHTPNGTGTPWIIGNGSWGDSGNLVFGYTDPKLVIKRDGHVGIGTTTPTKGRLQVKGSFHVENDSFQVFHVSSGKALVFVGKTAYEKYQAERANDTSVINQNQFSLWVSEGVVSENYVIAGVNDWDDYVFNANYQLPSLRQTAAFIKKNKHLPNFPSEAEVKKDGYNLHRMNRNFLKTIEELTLYAIDQEKRINELEAKIKQCEQLAAEVAQLKAAIEELKR